MQEVTPNLIIKNIQIFSESGIIKNGYIKVKQGIIAELGQMTDLRDTDGYQEIVMQKGYSVIPGLIDVHIHGVNGADVMDGTAEALHTMAVALPKEGTTSFLATTMTQSEEEIERALINAGNFIENQTVYNHAEVLGIHLEGPFVNKKMAGAQPVQFIIPPQVEVFKKWQSLSKNRIKLVTLAPEMDRGLELIQYLKQTGVIASIGHSHCTYDQVMDAIQAGASQVTHLFNQMSGLHHREPGVVGAAFLREELKAELIADGIHVRPEAVKIAHHHIGSDRLILITDSMRAKCLKNGTYDLGGQDVIVQDGKAVLRDGTLAGSILKLGNALKNMMAYTGCTLAEAVKMGSENPAKQLQVFDRKGSLAEGKDADLVILNEEYDVSMTICRGFIVFNKNNNE